MSIRFVALFAVAASLCLVSSASAFGHRAAGCGCAAPSCCEVVVAEPTCCEVSCDPCARQGLFAKLKARKAAKACCAPAPTCCEPAPVACCEPAPVACCEPAPVACCEPAPVACCEPAPVACCEAAPTCGKKPGCFAKLKARRAAKKCCAPAPTCCEAAPSCGCGM